MEISLSGKRALVTGAAQGIGLAVMKKLVACGAQVVAIDIQEEKLMEAVKNIPDVEPVVLDLGQWSSIEPSLKSIGRVQLVVNVAGIICDATIQDMQEDDVNRTLDVNLKGVMAVCKYVVNDWVTADIPGSIVNIASVAASRPIPRIPVYSASKAGLLQYTRCLALDCAPKGIRVNAVSPGSVATEMHKHDFANPEALEFHNRTVPMTEKMIDPEDIANAVAFLLCDKVARRITGVNLNVDSGFMLT